MSIFSSFKQMWSLVVGLSITTKYFFSPTVTVHYPRQTVDKDLTDSFRGPIELVGTDKDPSIPKCISCMLCVQACPSDCISVARSPAPKLSAEEQKAFDEAVARGENPKKPAAPKNPSQWEYNFSRCSLCACCVEACPVNSIRFSHDFYLVGTGRDDFLIDQLARLKRKAAERKDAAATAEPAAPKPAASGKEAAEQAKEAAL